MNETAHRKTDNDYYSPSTVENVKRESKEKKPHLIIMSSGFIVTLSIGLTKRLHETKYICFDHCNSSILIVANKNVCITYR